MCPTSTDKPSDTKGPGLLVIEEQELPELCQNSTLLSHVITRPPHLISHLPLHQVTLIHQKYFLEETEELQGVMHLNDLS